MKVKFKVLTEEDHKLKLSKLADSMTEEQLEELLERLVQEEEGDLDL